MQLRFVSILVSDQDAALRFYTDKLQFKKMADIMMGDYRFLTVSAPDGIEGVQLILEPNDFPPAQVYQKARHSAGIPAISITSTDIHADYERLTNLGVAFKAAPVDQGPVTGATFDDTCGNLVYLVQPKKTQGRTRR